MKVHVGPDPLGDCAETSTLDDEDPEAWPPDMDDDQKGHIHDLLKYVDVVTVTWLVFVQRLDLCVNGDVDVYDALKLVGITPAPARIFRVMKSPCPTLRRPLDTLVSTKDDWAAMTFPTDCGRRVKAAPIAWSGPSSPDDD